MVGGLPREGVVAEKFVPSLESLFSLGFKWGAIGMSREFCRDVPDPWRFKSVCNKMFVLVFAGLFAAEFSVSEGHSFLQVLKEIATTGNRFLDIVPLSVCL